MDPRPAEDDYITGKRDFLEHRPTVTDIWMGDYVWEYQKFISPEIVTDTLHKVYSDRDRWYPYVEEGVETDIIWCMGQNFWSLPNHPKFDEVFQPELRSYMLERYSVLNTHLEDFCENYLDKQPEYVPDIATPGFNIVVSELYKTWWHQDAALIRKLPDIDPDRIISVALPIQTDPESHTEFRMTDSETYKLTHNPGHMLIWPGRKIHRFGCQTITSDHYRITYQCHIYDAGDRALIYF